MKKNLIMICLCAALVVPAFAAEPVWDSALKQMPADTVGFISVPSIEQLDGDIKQGLTYAGLIMFVPPPYNQGPVGMFLQQNLMLDSETLDKAGFISVVILPLEGEKPNVEDFENNVAIMLSSKDPAKMLETMGAVKGEAGVWSLSLDGAPSFATEGEKCIIVSPTADAAKKIAGAKKGLKLGKHDMNVLNQSDLAIWVDWSKTVYPFRDQIHEFMDSPMFQMMTGGMAGMGAMNQNTQYEMNDEGELVEVKSEEAKDEPFDIQAEYAKVSQKSTKEQITMLLDGVEKGVFGLSFTAEELVFRVGMTATKDSLFGKMVEASPTTTKSLLAGLPMGKWVVAGGQLSSKINNEQAMKQFMPMVDLLGKFEGVDQEAFKTARDALHEMATMGTAARFYLGTQDPGPDGVITMAAVSNVGDAAKNLDLLKTFVENAKKAIPAKALEEEKELQMILDAFTYTPDAEEIAGVKVSHLKIDLKGVAEKSDEIDIEEFEELFKVIGQDGILIRFAAPTKDISIGTFGGKEFTKNVIEQVKSNKAPLEEEPTIAAANKNLPKEKNSVFLISIDNLVAGIANGMKSIDEEEQLPVVLMPIEMPITFAGTADGNWGGGECHIPLKAVQSITGGVMQMMMGAAMGGPGGPGGPAPGGPAPGGPAPGAPKPAPAPEPKEKIAA